MKIILHLAFKLFDKILNIINYFKKKSRWF